MFSEAAYAVQMPGLIDQRPLQNNYTTLQFNLIDKELAWTQLWADVSEKG